MELHDVGVFDVAVERSCRHKINIGTTSGVARGVARLKRWLGIGSVVSYALICRHFSLAAFCREYNHLSI